MHQTTISRRALSCGGTYIRKTPQQQQLHGLWEIGTGASKNYSIFTAGSHARTYGVDIPELCLSIEDKVAQLVADLAHLHAINEGGGG